MSEARNHPAGGFALPELMLALGVMVLATTALIAHLALNYRFSRGQRERVQAFTIAKSIMAEIHALAEAGDRDMDDLDDGVTRNPTLCIATENGELVSPEHALSGNTRRNGDWVWSRLISVRPLPGLDNRKLRYVSVRVYKQDEKGTPREVANLSSIVNSLSESFPTSQVYDVYFLAIENIPGWWVHMEAVRPFMEAMVMDLERSNPGLTIRSHWITKASYGRNKEYRPYINHLVDSNQETPGVYYYPGLMPEGSASTYYYVPGAMKARMLTDDGEINGYDADLNPYPYALADFFNHGMRYPQELAFHEKRLKAIRARKQAIADAKAAGTTPPDELSDMSEEPTWRLLLEDMCSHPDDYKYALFINLHGELLPMPSIRNYSDAAKSPGTEPHVRVVTHPEELRTYRDPSGSASDDAVFRVYAYVTNPDDYSGDDRLGSSTPILLEIPGVDLTDGSGGLRAGVDLECLQGGVTVNLSKNYSPFASAPLRSSARLLAGEMCYTAYYRDPGVGEEKETLIALYNTPVVAPLVTNLVDGKQQGIANDPRARLYGLEYLPGSPGATDFSNDLASDGTGPKNTARWRLRVGASMLTTHRFVKPDGTYYNPDDDVVLTVRTRIYNDDVDWETTGTLYPTTNDPDNLSETYTWWADSRDDVPFTERSQFLGDPRYNPYKDLLHGDPDFPDGYNWFFDSLQNATDVTGDYPGFDKNLLQNCWGGQERQDVNRYFELLRTGLARSSAIYTTMTGWSYYYMAHGAEIGYDSANGYSRSIPTILTPFGDNGRTGYIDNITGNRRYVRGAGSSGAYWLGMPWLGELYPDDYYSSQWMDIDADGHISGNLKPGDGTDLFYQEVDQTAYTDSPNLTTGTALYSAHQRLSGAGCGMFFNTGNSSSTFNHRSASGNGSLVGPGLELASNYNVDLPSSTSINRPFSLTTSNSPSGWNNPPYSDNRFLTSLVRTYYTAPVDGYTGSGVIELRPPDDSSSAYVIVNGLAQTTTLGTGALARYSLLTMIHTLFEASDPALHHPVPMIPRIELTYPTEVTELTAPATIDLTFGIEWKRWDGSKYTESTPGTFASAESDLEYLLMYSRDGGRTWQHITDDSPAEPGVRPDSASCFVADGGTGPETYTWDTPADEFPSGSYLVRVEVYRTGQALHYAYHQRKIFIDR